MWMPAHTTRPAFDHGRERQRHQRPDGRKENGCVERLRRASVGIAGPFRTQLSRERLTVGVAGAGEREHPPALVPSHLRHQMSGGAEAVDAEPLRVAGGAERPVPDQAGTEQRRGVDIGDAGRERETESLIRHRVLGVAAIHLVAGEAGPVAEVLPSRPAVHTCSAGPGQPGDAHAVARPEPVGAGSGPTQPWPRSRVQVQAGAWDRPARRQPRAGRSGRCRRP